MLVCDWPYSDWTKYLYVKMLFKQGFRYLEEFQKILQVRKVGSLPAVRTTCPPVRRLICP
jgi:hypothetical protein